MHLSQRIRYARIAGKMGVFFTLLLVLACGSDDPKPATEEDPIAEGKMEVTEHGCPTCHEPKESGIGTLAGQTTPQPNTQAYPANLTPDEETGIGDFTEAQIVEAILHGIDDENEMLCPPMPHFADQGLDEDEAKEIAAYLKSLPPVHHEVPESTCPQKGGEGDAG
jgi:mono/diheme cytochrome c family protein